MIKIDGIEIAERLEEFGIQWSDGDQSWGHDGSGLEEEEARVIAWHTEGASLLKRVVFVSVPEVAE